MEELKDEEKWKTREVFDASKKKSVLVEDEKWKTREVFDASKKKSVVVDDDEDAPGEERRSPTPHSATKSYRPDGTKKVKGTKAGDNDLKEGFDAIVTARKGYAEEKNC